MATYNNHNHINHDHDYTMIITTIQDTAYLLWQAELLYWNCRATIIIGYRDKPSAYALALAQHCAAILIEDTRKDMGYAPSIQPHLLSKIATAKSGQVMLVDSDVIFKAPLTIEPHPCAVRGSDCSSYLNSAYLDGCDPRILGGLCEIAGIPAEYVRSKEKAVGAQYVFPNLISKEFWAKVESDSNTMHTYLKECSCALHPVQTWTASMWAILYALYAMELRGEVAVIADPSLDFCFATDPMELWGRKGILHCAGVHASTPGYFRKGDYAENSPFGKNLAGVSPSNCSYIYAEKIREYSAVRRSELCH